MSATCSVLKQCFSCFQKISVCPIWLTFSSWILSATGKPSTMGNIWRRDSIQIFLMSTKVLKHLVQGVRQDCICSWQFLHWNGADLSRGDGVWCSETESLMLKGRDLAESSLDRSAAFPYSLHAVGIQGGINMVWDKTYVVFDIEAMNFLLPLGWISCNTSEGREKKHQDIEHLLSRIFTE